MNKKTSWAIIGFLLFFFGFLALILNLVGLKLSFLSFIDSAGGGIGLLIKLIMIFGGMVIFYVSRTDNSV